MTRLWTTDLVNHLAELFEQHADPERAVEMKRYMRDQLSFFGIDARNRTELQRLALRGSPAPTEVELARIANA